MCYSNEARPPPPPIAGGAANARELILLAADGNRFRARAARAVQPSGAGIVILPDVRGLHPFYEQLAERFAESGIDAVAMDYFGRTAGLTARGDDFEWQSHVSQTTEEGTKLDVMASAAYLRGQEGGGAESLFTIGFCFGGSASWLQAAHGLDLKGAIGFYGRPNVPRPGWPAPIDSVKELACPILGVFGGDDPAIPPDAIEEFDAVLTDANVPHEFVVYPGAPHSFFDRRRNRFRPRVGRSVGSGSEVHRLAQIEGPYGRLLAQSKAIARQQASDHQPAFAAVASLLQRHLL